MTTIRAEAEAGPLEVVASIAAGLRRLGDQHDRLIREFVKRETLRARMPSDVRLFGNALIPTPTARTGINLGGPDAGFYWLLRRLVVGGVTWKTSASGTAEVYVTALGGSQGGAVTGPIITALSLTDVVDQFGSLPVRAFYTNRQVIVQENENLMVVIDTGTQAQVYSCAAQFEVHRTIAATEVTPT